jgi:hypothetical protein
MKFEVKVWCNDFSDLFEFNKIFILYITGVYIWEFSSIHAEFVFISQEYNLELLVRLLPDFEH